MYSTFHTRTAAQSALCVNDNVRTSGWSQKSIKTDKKKETKTGKQMKQTKTVKLGYFGKTIKGH